MSPSITHWYFAAATAKLGIVPEVAYHLVGKGKADHLPALLMGDAGDSGNECCLYTAPWERRRLRAERWFHGMRKGHHDLRPGTLFPCRTSGRLFVDRPETG